MTSLSLDVLNTQPAAEGRALCRIFKYCPHLLFMSLLSFHSAHSVKSQAESQKSCRTCPRLQAGYDIARTPWSVDTQTLCLLQGGICFLLVTTSCGSFVRFIVFIWNTLHRFTFGAPSEFLVSGCHRFPPPWMASQLPCYKGWEPWARVGFLWHGSCCVFYHSHEKNNWSSQCALFTEISIFTPNHLTNLRKIHFFRWFPLPFPSQWLLLYEMVFGQIKKKVLLEISTYYISIKHWAIFKHESFTLGSIRDKMF